MFIVMWYVNGKLACRLYKKSDNIEIDLVAYSRIRLSAIALSHSSMKQRNKDDIESPSLRKTLAHISQMSMIVPIEVQGADTSDIHSHQCMI